MESATERVSILLVDDRPENLLALEATLGSHRYRLVRALSGKEALRRLLDEEFALIILDVQMPEMDGFETASLIRKQPLSRRIPIIFVTAIHRDVSHIHQGYETGAVDYILKPFDPSLLQSKVAVFAELYLQKREIQLQAETLRKQEEERRRQEQRLQREREERRRSEEAHRHFKDLVDRLDHSIVWEAEWPALRFRFVSKRAEALLGYPHGKWFEEENFFLSRVHREDRPRVERAIRNAVENRVDERFEHRMIARDGELLWFHTGVQAEPGSSTQMLRGLTVDITPLMLSEEELRRREARFRRVVDANMIGHIFADFQGRLLDANDCFLEMIGYSRADLATRQLRWSELTPEEFRDADARAISELRETGVCTPFEKEFLHRDGHRVPVMLGAALLEGTLDECVCFVLDMSERKQAEEEKFRAVRAREELLEVVSHDLKNPLGAILMNAALLFRQLPSGSIADGAKQQIEIIQRSAHRMRRLIEDLLDLAKVEAGRLVLEISPCSLRGLMDEIRELFQAQAEQSGIRLETVMRVEDCVIYCDHDRMLQVLSNLVGNAVKFTPGSGTVRVEVNSCGERAYFSVSDTGPGIAAENIPRIFDRYWQASQANRLGAGLGLSIAKGIVDAHRGEIWVESQPGVGTTFFFSIPNDRPAAAASPSA